MLTGSHMHVRYDGGVFGTPPSRRRKLRQAVAWVASARSCGRCLTSALALDLGRDPEYALAQDVPARWIEIITAGAPERAAAQRAWPPLVASLRRAKRHRCRRVDGPASGGTLTTVPIKFTGARLELNALTKSKGQIVVELLDASARPIKGFAPSSTIKGDDLRHQVKFSGDISQLSGHSIMLRFHLTNASLFSFAFRKNDG